MGQDREFSLEFNEKTMVMIEEFSKKTGQAPEQVVERIIHEHLMNQLPFIERMASETGKPLSEIVNQQFMETLEFLLQRQNKINSD